MVRDSVLISGLFQSFNQNKRKSLRKKARFEKRKKIIFHQNNAPAHKSVLVMGILNL
jgi:hypothetical protein